MSNLGYVIGRGPEVARPIYIYRVAGHPGGPPADLQNS
jgi:hypothetical protein